MKRLLSVTILMLCIALLLSTLTACGEESETTTTAAAPSSSTAPSTASTVTTAPATESTTATTAPATESTTATTTALTYTGPEMELTVNLSSSEQLATIYVDALNRITERTGGKVTFVIYYSNSLMAPPEALDGLGSGLADISDVTLTNFPDRFVYTQQVTSYPFLGFTSLAMAADVMNDVIEQGLNLVEGPVVTKWVAGLGTGHKDFPESMASGFGPQGTES